MSQGLFGMCTQWGVPQVSTIFAAESGICLCPSMVQNIYYEDTGGRGPAMVFSHGLLMDHTMFEPQIQALQGSIAASAGTSAVTGQTADPEHCEAFFDCYDSADDLAALLKYLGVEKAVLVGMSQGGYLSLRCAPIPDVVRALVLIDTQAMLEDPEQMPPTRRC